MHILSRLIKQLTAILLVLTPSLFCACKQSNLPAGVATNMQSAFQATASNVREFAEQGVEAEGKGDFGTAFIHYRALSLNPELTQAQRDAASQSMIEMNKKLREAAKNGDKEAEKVLDNYRATR